MDTRTGEPKRNEKMIRSVDTLKELYTVAVGVALVMAVETWQRRMPPPQCSAVTVSSCSLWLL